MGDKLGSLVNDKLGFEVGLEVTGDVLGFSGFKVRGDLLGRLVGLSEGVSVGIDVVGCKVLVISMGIVMSCYTVILSVGGYAWINR